MAGTLRSLQTLGSCLALDLSKSLKDDSIVSTPPNFLSCSKAVTKKKLAVKYFPGRSALFGCDLRCKTDASDACWRVSGHLHDRHHSVYLTSCELSNSLTSSRKRHVVPNSTKDSISRARVISKVSVSPQVAVSRESDKDHQARLLDREICHLRSLLKELQSVSTWTEKASIIEADSRVRSVFGGRSGGKYVKPAVQFALGSLDHSDVYLLQCLVASGQEHLLDTPVVQENYWEGQQKVGAPTYDGYATTTPMKDAFSVLAQIIEGWDSADKKSLVSDLIDGWNSPGVFPTQLLQMIDWEGRFTQEKESSRSVISQFLQGWDSPGLFPAQILDLVDFEGKLEQRASVSPADMDCECDNTASYPRPLRERLHNLLGMLRAVDRFYDSIGGILGYQLASLELVRAAEEEKSAQHLHSSAASSISHGDESYYVPVGRDLSRDKEYATQAAFWGLEKASRQQQQHAAEETPPMTLESSADVTRKALATTHNVQGLPQMAEIYPLGGAGDRLGLMDEETGECLPVAMLPYCGRTLLEGLIRDLQENYWEGQQKVGAPTYDGYATTTPMKDAFSVLAQIIEGWDSADKKSLVSDLIDGWNSPGVFPTQLLQMIDWEGRFTQEKESSRSVISQFLQGWDSPGLFPAQILDLVDFEGKLEQRASVSPADMDCECDNTASYPRPLRERLHNLLGMLRAVDRFYDSIGGILGYQLASLELVRAAEEEKSAQHLHSSAASSISHGDESYYVPVGRDLSRDKEYATQAAFWGLEKASRQQQQHAAEETPPMTLESSADVTRKALATTHNVQGLPQMAEIYPLGGAGDRLGLMDEETGECLPVAMLPYCGRTLLEGLIRDLQARDYLHFRVFGKRHITPVAIMTSAAKQNHQRVQALCESKGWFGRGAHNFRLFEQPLVPAVRAEDGRWLCSEPLTAVLKPGGHGAIWKLAYDEGIFEWFRSCNRKAAVTRQISNPFAATDVTMLALSGTGLKYNKKLGFASCDRNIGTAEGVNVVAERRLPDGSWAYCTTCVEYTEFDKLGLADLPAAPGSMQSQYPANSNVLYVDLAAVEELASSQGRAALPGMIMNLKKEVKFVDDQGRKHSVRAGRLECTMQNIADSLTNTSPTRISRDLHGELDTFLLYNDRRKVTSSAKRRRKPDDLNLHQTPDGSFLDLNRNAADLLSSCGVVMPKMENNQCYLESGPPFIVLFNPALGPLWDVIRQKLDTFLLYNDRRKVTSSAKRRRKPDDLNLHQTPDGSFLDLNRNAADLLSSCGVVMPKMENNQCYLESGPPFIVLFNPALGPLWDVIRQKRVRFENAGVDWEDPTSVFWQHKVQRRQSCRIVLHGDAEFDASNVTIQGTHTFEVPDGHCMKVTTAPDGGVSCKLEALASRSDGRRNTWEWVYSAQEKGRLELTMAEY
eukprot:jgi/Mesen1/7760/ME000408S06868